MNTHDIHQFVIGASIICSFIALTAFLFWCAAKDKLILFSIVTVSFFGGLTLLRPMALSEEDLVRKSLGQQCEEKDGVLLEIPDPICLNKNAIINLEPGEEQ